MIENTQYIAKIKQELESVNGFKADLINEERIRKLESNSLITQNWDVK